MCLIAVFALATAALVGLPGWLPPVYKPEAGLGDTRRAMMNPGKMNVLPRANSAGRVSWFVSPFPPFPSSPAPAGGGGFPGHPLSAGRRLGLSL